MSDELQDELAKGLADDAAASSDAPPSDSGDNSAPPVEAPWSALEQAKGWGVDVSGYKEPRELLDAMWGTLQERDRQYQETQQSYQRQLEAYQLQQKQLADYQRQLAELQKPKEQAPPAELKWGWKERFANPKDVRAWREALAADDTNATASSSLRDYGDTVNEFLHTLGTDPLNALQPVLDHYVQTNLMGQIEQKWQEREAKLREDWETDQFIASNSDEFFHPQYGQAFQQAFLHYQQQAREGGANPGFARQYAITHARAHFQQATQPAAQQAVPPASQQPEPDKRDTFRKEANRTVNRNGTTPRSPADPQEDDLHQMLVAELA